MKTNLPRLTCWLILLVATATGARATDYYMTVSGSGAMDGSSWANSFTSGSTSMATVLDGTMHPGDTLYVGSGTYTAVHIQPTTSGSAGAQKSIIGVDLGGDIPLFIDSGTMQAHICCTFADSVGYWTLKNLRCQVWNTAVTSTGTNHPGLVFDTIDVKYVHRGFVFTDADNILMQSCRADRYSEFGYYFVNSCDGVTMESCVADCSGLGQGDDSAWRASISNPVGFNFHFKGSTAPYNTNILLEDCEALNNDSDQADDKGFQQGDGFKTEDRNDGVIMRRCLSHRNQDGPVDMKGQNILLEDCISWDNNTIGYKVWYSGTLNNCIAVGNGSWGLWESGTVAGGYTVTANNCTFVCSGSNGWVLIGVDGNFVNLNNCIFTFTGTPSTYIRNGTVSFSGCALASNASNPANGPRFVNPVLPWDGTGTDYDSQTFGSFKGYNSAGELYHLNGGSRYECELLAVSGSSDATSTVKDVVTSGTNYQKLASNAVNDYISYTVPSVPAGTYTVTVGAKAGAPDGQFQLTIDGTNQGAVQDTYSATAAYLTCDLGSRTFATTGNRTFKFTVTGKNTSATNYNLLLDYIELTPVTGGIIGVHPAESGTSPNLLLATDTVGVIPSANWNNSTTNNQTLTNVVDSTGSATTVDVVFNNTAAGYANATGTFAAPMDDDSKMMRSMRAMSNDPTMSVTASQIPYALYDVYVYWGGRTVGETVPATMEVDFMLQSGSTWVTNQTLYMADTDHAWNGVYNESLATTGTAAVDGNNYVVFRNQTSPSFRISSTCGRRTGINGFQIIEK